MSPLIRRELSWWDPTALARALAARCGAEGLVLLDGDGGPQGLKAVLGVDPIETVCCRGLPADAGATDPFAALRAMGERGGPWLGWLAYEAGAWLEPSVPWRDPEMATLWAVRHDPLIHFDLAARCCWLEGRDPLRLEALAELIAALPAPPSPLPPLTGSATPLATLSTTTAWSQACAPGAGLAGLPVGDAAEAAAGPRLRDGTGAAAARPVPPFLASPTTAVVPQRVSAGGRGPGALPLDTGGAAVDASRQDAAALPPGEAVPREAVPREVVPGGEAVPGEGVATRTPVAPTPSGAAAIPLEAWHWHTSPQAYASQVGELLERIAAGDLFQANLTACCETWLQAPPDPLALWERLSRACPAPFAGVAIGSGDAAGEAVISASPERFLQLSPDGLVETRPIKGTRPRSADPDRDAAAAAALVCDPKDRAENVMIVDLLRNDLGRVCEPGSISVPQLVGLESYAQVHHLTSVVCGQLQPERDPVDLLRACWPGGSISGAPKLRACTRLHGLEPVPRGPYCGSLFHWDAAGGFDSSILIRSVMVQGRRLRVHAGGGIVADSDPAAEAEEMGWKIGPLLEALA